VKRLFLYVALALSVFTFTATVQADDYEGFAPVVDQQLVDTDIAVAIAGCERCMYAGLGDKQPLIAMVKPNNDGRLIPFEVGWRS